MEERKTEIVEIFTCSKCGKVFGCQEELGEEAGESPKEYYCATCQFEQACEKRDFEGTPNESCFPDEEDPDLCPSCEVRRMFQRGVYG